MVGAMYVKAKIKSINRDFYDLKTILALASIAFCMISLVGCGGGGATSSQTPSVTEKGSITGTLKVPVGSKPTSRIAEANQTTVPLEGAKVEAYRGGSKIAGPEYSNPQGVFTLTNVSVGSCVLKINADGYTEETIDVAVTANTTTTVGGETGIALQPVSYGTLKVTSNVAGAGIILDDVDTGVDIPESLEAAFESISVGDHEVVLVHDGYEKPATQTVSITEGATSTVSFTVIPAGVELKIDVCCTALKIGEYTKVTLKYVYGDGSEEDVTDTAEWIISGDAAGVSESTRFLIAAVEGTSTISARVGSLTSNAINVTVSGTVLGTRDDWPTYQHDNLRTGKTSESLSPPLKPVWIQTVERKSGDLAASEGYVVFNGESAFRVSDGRFKWSLGPGGLSSIYNNELYYSCGVGMYCDSYEIGKKNLSDGLTIWKNTFSGFNLAGKLLVYQHFFCATQSYGDEIERFACRDTIKGDILWEKYATIHIPLQNENTIYGIQGMYAMTTGHIGLWDIQTGEDVADFPGPDTEVRKASLTENVSLVYTTARQHIILFSMMDLVQMWNYDTVPENEDLMYSSDHLSIQSSAFNTIFVTSSYTQKIYALDENTGALNWSFTGLWDDIIGSNENIILLSALLGHHFRTIFSQRATCRERFRMRAMIFSSS
ncbi:MAG: carboxypeptidase regulatory-like domain-containing protein [bacterium]